MSLIQRLGVLLVLWFPISVACIASVCVVLIMVLVSPKETVMGYAKTVLSAMDKVMAALFGFDGKHTFSAECGADNRWWCKAVVWTLDRVQKGHCLEAAKKEGLL